MNDSIPYDGESDSIFDSSTNETESSWVANTDESVEQGIVFFIIQ